jgi:PSP1 C-terminal conserved region
MGHAEYLLTYGNAGAFGRFAYPEPLACRRGDRVVVRSPRGQELGVVMRPANPEHGRLLADQFVGQILRCATEGDLQLAERMQQRGQRLFEDGRRLVREWELPMDILDVEVLLDGRQAVVHYLRWVDCDPRPLMDSLSQNYRLLITLHDLALPSTEVDEEPVEHGGCGVAGCGGGGCGSCSAGNCASCGSHRQESERKTPTGAKADARRSHAREIEPGPAMVPAAALEAAGRVPLL